MTIRMMRMLSMMRWLMMALRVVGCMGACMVAGVMSTSMMRTMTTETPIFRIDLGLSLQHHWCLSYWCRRDGLCLGLDMDSVRVLSSTMMGPIVMGSWMVLTACMVTCMMNAMMTTRHTVTTTAMTTTMTASL